MSRSSSWTVGSLEFKHSSSHCLQILENFKPVFWQLHLEVEQLQVQLHKINFKIDYGACSSTGFNSWKELSFFCHCKWSYTCVWTLNCHMHTTEILLKLNKAVIQQDAKLRWKHTTTQINTDINSCHSDPTDSLSSA